MIRNYIDMCNFLGCTGNMIEVNVYQICVGTPVLWNEK